MDGVVQTALAPGWEVPGAMSALLLPAQLLAPPPRMCTGVEIRREDACRGRLALSPNSLLARKE